VSAGGTTWLIYNTPGPSGNYPVEGGVVSFTINASGQTTFTQASPSYDLSLHYQVRPFRKDHLGTRSQVTGPQTGPRKAQMGMVER